MIVKTCSKCKIGKLITAFSPDPRHVDGLQSQCKACKKIYRVAHKEEIAEYRRGHRKEAASYRRSPAGKKTQKKSDKKCRLKYPEKEKARQAVKYAVRTGRLIRPWYCELCFITCQPEAHHLDYSKPLEVEWLCFDCHKKLHKRENVMEFIREVG